MGVATESMKMAGSSKSPRDRRPPPSDEDDRGPPPFDDTHRLLQRFQGGDSLALNELCERYLRRLRRWASGRLPPDARGLVDTDDLAQEVLTRTLRRLGSFEYRGRHALQAYVRRALHNRIVQEVRRCRHAPDRLEDGDQYESDWPSPLENLVGKELFQRYESALERLRQIDREVVLAKLELGCGFQEIAEILEMPSVEAARKAVYRALVRLAKEMADSE